MTVFVTVISGVLVFVFGQTILKLVIDPVNEMKNHIGNVAFSLLQHSNVYGNAEVLNANDNLSNIKTELRSHASNLLRSTSIIPFYSKTSKLFSLPSEEEVEKAITSLIALSNSLVIGNPRHIAEKEREVFESLKIYLYKDWKTEIITKDE